MSGGNLTYTERPILINTLAYDDLGVYAYTNPDNSSDTDKILIFKKHGLSLPYDNFLSASLSKTQDGALKSILLKTLAPAPCSDCNYDYGINVKKDVKNPGVLNDDFQHKARFYGGTIEAIQTPSGGQLVAADKITIEDDIIAQILSDRNTKYREEAIVDGRRLYKCTVSGADTNKIIITDSAGATETITMNTGATIITMCQDFNHDNTKGLIAFALSSTVMAVTSSAVGTVFTLADGAGATTVTFERFIWLASRDADNKFWVDFDLGFMSVERFNLLVLDNAYSSGTTSFTSGGINTHAITMHANSATCVTNINGSHWHDGSDSAFTTIGYASCLNTDAVTAGDIYIYSGVVELMEKTLSTGVTINTAYSGGGRYPQMTGEDVFRIFSNKRDLGALSNQVYLEQPDPTAKYCKLTLQFTNPIASQHGASHMNDYRQKIELYIKQGNTSNIWADGTTYIMETGSAKNINDILDLWCGGTFPVDII